MRPACHCVASYYGTHCDAFDMCAADEAQCDNGGQCEAEGNVWGCHCAGGYVGRTCGVKESGVWEMSQFTIFLKNYRATKGSSERHVLGGHLIRILQGNYRKKAAKWAALWQPHNIISKSLLSFVCTVAAPCTFQTNGWWTAPSQKRKKERESETRHPSCFVWSPDRLFVRSPPLILFYWPPIRSPKGNNRVLLEAHHISYREHLTALWMRCSCTLTLYFHFQCGSPLNMTLFDRQTADSCVLHLSFSHSPTEICNEIGCQNESTCVSSLLGVAHCKCVGRKWGEKCQLSSGMHKQSHHVGTAMGGKVSR